MKAMNEWLGELLNEKAKSPFKMMQDAKKPLDDAERDKVMKAKAIWHHGPGGKASPAVWKSVHPTTGKVTYVTHTHRAFASAPTLEGAIKKFHGDEGKENGIKHTA